MACRRRVEYHRGKIHALDQLHNFGVAHSFVDARESADYFLDDAFAHFHGVDVALEVFFGELVHAYVRVDLHGVEVVEVADFGRDFRELLIEGVGDVVRGVRGDY